MTLISFILKNNLKKKKKSKSVKLNHRYIVTFHELTNVGKILSWQWREKFKFIGMWLRHAGDTHQLWEFGQPTSGAWSLSHSSRPIDSRQYCRAHRIIAWSSVWLSLKLRPYGAIEIRLLFLFYLRYLLPREVLKIDENNWRGMMLSPCSQGPAGCRVAAEQHWSAAPAPKLADTND